MRTRPAIRRAGNAVALSAGHGAFRPLPGYGTGRSGAHDASAPSREATEGEPAADDTQLTAAGDVGAEVGSAVGVTVGSAVGSGGTVAGAVVVGIVVGGAAVGGPGGTVAGGVAVAGTDWVAAGSV
jgi:hypothetical protein